MIGGAVAATRQSGTVDAERPVLEVRDLRTHLRSSAGVVRAVDGVSFSIGQGEVFAVVGESGSGKSMMAKSIMGLAPGDAPVRSGEILFEGQDLRKLGAARLRRLRGDRIAMVFQDPLTSLNPVLTVGHQVAEALRVHRDIGRQEAWERAVDALQRIGIPNAARRARDYPHQFSGGMQQRVMIAMAMICDPALLIADEPTTALDVTIQAQILELLLEIRDTHGTSILLITHDLGVVAGVSDRTAVMYAGQLHEIGPTDRIFAAPRGPYTVGLLRSNPGVEGRTGRPLTPVRGAPPSLVGDVQGCRFAPRCDLVEDACRVGTIDLVPRHDAGEVRCLRPPVPPDAQVRSEARAVPIAAGTDAGVMVSPGPGRSAPDRSGEALLHVEDLHRSFRVRRLGEAGSRELRAVDGVSFDLHRGETLGLVGESGCGKSTTARLVARLLEPTGGRILFEGEDIAGARGGDLRRFRRSVQLVFQDPYSSLNPRMTVESILLEPLRVHGLLDPRRSRDRVREILEMVGLEQDHAERYPHMFSGGQRQRIGIARALMLDPRLIILDEPVSALDVSIQAQILNLLERLRRELDLTFLFISHDLSVVRHVSDRVAVMYLGRIVEMAECEDLYAAPSHPYSQSLLSAVPIPDPELERVRRRILLQGDPPSPIDPPTGCHFGPRCHLFEDRCLTAPALERRPGVASVPAATLVACHRAGAPAVAPGGDASP